MVLLAGLDMSINCSDSRRGNSFVRIDPSCVLAIFPKRFLMAKVPGNKGEDPFPVSEVPEAAASPRMAWPGLAEELSNNRRAEYYW
jgi:hypothetical protein